MIRRSRTHVAAAAVLLVMWCSGMAAALLLPDRVPLHWNFRGEVDADGSGWVVAFILPAIASVTAVALLLLQRTGPFAANLERSSLAYGRCVMAVLLMLLVAHGLLLAVGFGAAISFVAVLNMVSGLLVAALGNWLGKLRRNCWIGIRTPWTLANDAVWERTHRIGGGMLVVLGLGVAVASLLVPPLTSVAFLIGGLLVLAVWSGVYSLWIYRRLGQVDQA